MAAGASASTRQVAIAAPAPPPSLAAGSLALPEALPPSAATTEAKANDVPTVAEQAAPEPAATIPGPPAARNPWADPIPRELKFAHKLAADGGKASERLVLALIAYNQAHADDARGRLLLGELYLDRLWRKDAMEQFASALQLDLSARGAPELLPALIALVVQGKVASEAERLIVKTYGSEALGPIADALASVRDPRASARLRSLRARLAKT
jgi:hypothetical protein